MRLKYYIICNRFFFLASSLFVLVLLISLKGHWHEAFQNNNNLESAISLWSFKPFLSIFLNDFLWKNSNEWIKLALCYVFFAFFCFYFVAKSIHYYLNPLWSISLTFLSLLSFKNFPFRDFLFSLFWQKNLDKESLIFPEILGFPIPVFSTFYFVLLFHLSIKYFCATWRFCCVMTFFWSLLLYIQPVDGVFGLVFWLSFLFLKFVSRPKYFYIFRNSFIIAFLCIIPVFTSIEFGKLTNLESVSLNYSYYFIYFFLPLGLLIQIYFVSKVDPYELYRKFWHIFLLMFIEIFFIFFAVKFKVGIDIRMIKNRIPLFFLHIYYYIPFLYYATRKRLELSVDKKTFKDKLRRLNFFVFETLSWVYLPIFSLLLICFGVVLSH